MGLLSLLVVTVVVVGGQGGKPVQPAEEGYEPEYGPSKPTSHVSGQKAALATPEDAVNQPEYISTRADTLHAVPAKIDHSESFSDVAEYVAPAGGDNFVSGPVSASFLSVRSKATTYQHAGLTDDLERDIRNAPKGERYVQGSSTVHSRLSVSSPERSPKDLPQDKKDLFDRLATEYENNFRTHFEHPSPASFLEKGFIQPVSHSYTYIHTIKSEPQVMLPVPLSLFYESSSSTHQRDHLLNSALSDEHVQKLGKLVARSLLESFSKSAPASAAAVGAISTSGGTGSGDSTFNPLAFEFTPASLAVGFPISNMGYTPGSLSAWGPQAFTPEQTATYRGQIQPNMLQSGYSLSQQAMGLSQPQQQPLYPPPSIASNPVMELFEQGEPSAPVNPPADMDFSSFTVTPLEVPSLPR